MLEYEFLYKVSESVKQRIQHYKNCSRILCRWVLRVKWCSARGRTRRKKRGGQGRKDQFDISDKFDFHKCSTLARCTQLSFMKSSSPLLFWRRFRSRLRDSSLCTVSYHLNQNTHQVVPWQWIAANFWICGTAEVNDTMRWIYTCALVVNGVSFSAHSVSS